MNKNKIKGFQKLLDKLYDDLQKRLSISADSEEMELIYKIVALELAIEEETNK